MINTVRGLEELYLKLYKTSLISEINYVITEGTCNILKQMHIIKTALEVN